MTELARLELSHNSLRIHITENFSIPSSFPKLGSLMLASCHLQNIPLLRNQPSLTMLDLLDNQLKGEIPNWIWKISDGALRHLNLSHNQFTRQQEPYDIYGLSYFDLHSNMLGGRIPLPPPTVVYVDMSSNNFSSSLPPDIGEYLTRAYFFSIANNRIIGSIPPTLCNASLLQILDLSNNSLSGVIPSCLVTENLGVLNLRRNKLSGHIPTDAFPLGCGLQTLDLSENVLQGKVPKSLASCNALEVLNLGNNNLYDVFPCWFKNFTGLRILVLSFNRFYGDISCLQEDNNSHYTWQNLQIISLASNSFNGFLPSNLFRNLKMMMVDGNGSRARLDHLHFSNLLVDRIYYQDSITLTLKGQDVDFVKILTIVTSVDFSNSHLAGAIPQTVGELGSLYVLNLSHNILSGKIPESLGNLKQLGSLDLSFNNVGGEIPRQLAGLTFLSFLNLSYNRLVGRIPTGNQLPMFAESSFLGNEGLCGFPLNKSCENESTAPNAELEDHQERNWEWEMFMSAGLGFVVGIGVIFVPMLLSRRWRDLYNRHADKLVLLILNRQGKVMR